MSISLIYNQLNNAGNTLTDAVINAVTINDGALNLTGLLSSTANISTSGNLNSSNAQVNNLVCAGLNATGQAQFSSNVSVGSYLYVAGNSTINGNVTINGSIYASSGLGGVSGNISVSNITSTGNITTATLTVTGNTTINGNVTINGSIYASSGLGSGVSGNISVSNITCTGNLTAAGIIVTGNTTTATLYAPSATIPNLTITSVFGSQGVFTTLLSGNATLGNMTATSLYLSGSISTGNATFSAVTCSSIYVSGSDTDAGNISAANIYAGNNIYSGGVIFTGNIATQTSSQPLSISTGNYAQPLYLQGSKNANAGDIHMCYNSTNSNVYVDNGNFNVSKGNLSISTGSLYVANGLTVNNNSITVGNGSILFNSSGTCIQGGSANIIMYSYPTYCGINFNAPNNGSNFSILNGPNNSYGVYLTPTSTAWVGASDRRLKTNITEIDGCLDSLKSIKSYRFNRLINKVGPENDGISHIGFIAQEVQPLFPELVETDKDGFFGVKYSEMTPVLAGAINELNAKVDAIQEQLNKLMNSTF